MFITIKEFLTVVFLVFILVAVASAQEKSNTATATNADTLNPDNKINNFIFYQDNFQHLNKVNIPVIQTGISVDDGDIWLKTIGGLQQLDENDRIAETTSRFMLAPLRLQYLDSQKLTTLKQILTAAELSAAGVMAYQHIKKYGFIK